MNTMTRSMIAAGGLAAGLALSAHDAAATVVNLNNPNFDASVGLAPDSDQYITANTGTVAVPGWTINGFAGTTGTSGTLAPNYTSPGVYFNTTPNWSAPQVGAIGGTLTPLGAAAGNPSSISQNTSQTFSGSAGTITLNLSLGAALGTTLGTGGEALILANGGLALGTGLPVNLETGGTVLGAAITPGTFAAETYTFTLNGVQAAALAGDTVGIELYNPDTTAVFIDNVALSGTVFTAASSIPEPAGLPLLGIALLGFAAYHYRNKTKMLAL
jgi:hypothetical protein